MKRAATMVLASVGFMAGVQTLAQTPPTEHNVTITAQPDNVIPADEQATNEQLAKLFEVMRLRDQMQMVTKSMPAMIQQQVEAQSRELNAKLMPGVQLTPEQEEATRKVTQKYLEKAMTIYPVDEMIGDMTEIYKRHLNRADVDAFIAFYSSPAAQRLLDAQPVIMREYMPVVMKRIQERSKQLSDELAKDLQELVKSLAPAK